MKQKTRNAIYAVITAVLTIALVLGIISEVEKEELLGFTNVALDLGTNVIGLVASVLAWVKSRPSKVTTINVPMKEYESLGR